MSDDPAPIEIFCSYANEDEIWLRELETHLSLLKRQGLIATWHNRLVLPGTNREQDIDSHLNNASIILLLVSSDFLASDYCYDREMMYALERHKLGEARVIPIILRPCDWHSAPFGHLQCLPRDGKAVVTWQDKDEAFLTIAKELRRVIEGPQIPARPLSRVQQQNRTRLLKRVRATWIEGVLEHSLHQAALIALDLQEQPDALANPWRLEVQETNVPPHLLPAGTPLVQVYDEAEGELLILGEPGAGKTTLLLHLASDLLKRAEQESTFPMPVIFPLASWAEKGLALADWLIEELFLKYQVPRHVGHSWIKDDQLLLLLDGLDEVHQVHRSACLQAINAYRQEHNLVPVVLCSRKAEYEAQSTRVALSRAVVIQPLTSQQIDDYLTQAGQQLEAVRSLLHTDQELQALARTPLMLTILTLTYQGNAIDDLVTPMPPDVQRRHVLGTYVERMLQRRAASYYTPEQTKDWLAWLARQMVQHDQTEFYLERMQPDWLPNNGVRRFYHGMSRIVVGILIGWLVGQLVGGLLGYFSYASLAPSDDSFFSYGSITLGLFFEFFSIVVGVLAYGKWTIRKHRQEGMLSRKSIWQWIIKSTFIRSLVISALIIKPLLLIAGFLIGDSQPYLSQTYLYDFNDFSTDFLLYIMVPALLTGGLTGLLIDILMYGREEEILPAEILSWSWRNLWLILTNVKELGNAIGIGIVISGFVGLLQGIPLLYNGLYPGLSGILVNTVISLLIIFPSILLFRGVLRGFSGKAMEKSMRVKPNQGIWRSVRNSGFVALISSVIFMFTGGVVFVFTQDLIISPVQTLVDFLLIDLLHISTFEYLVGIFPPEADLASWFLIGLNIGLLMGLFFGGIACIQHIFLRLLLWRKRLMPWNYSRFLDYAAERILLRKVGGGYIFVHRLLLDYFASLEKKVP